MYIRFDGYVFMMSLVAVDPVTIIISRFCFASGAPDNIKVWKFPDGNFMQNFSGHQAIVNTVSVNSDNVLVSGGVSMVWCACACLIHDDVCVPSLEMCMCMCLVLRSTCVCASSYGIHVCLILFMMVYMCVCLVFGVRVLMMRCACVCALS